MAAKEPLLGSVGNPLISNVSSTHVILSKKLVGIIAVIILASALIFFSVEEVKIAAYSRSNRVGQLQTNAITKQNSLLQESEDSMKAEHEKLYDHFTALLEQEEEDLTQSEDSISSLKDQLRVIQNASTAFTKAINDKEKLLEEKEDFLDSYQFKVQSKQQYIEALADVMKTMHLSVPSDVSIDSGNNDFVWNDEPDDDALLYDEDDDLFLDDDWSFASKGDQQDSNDAKESNSAS